MTIQLCLMNEIFAKNGYQMKPFGQLGSQFCISINERWNNYYVWKRGKRISVCYYCPHLTSILFRMLNAIMIFTLIFHWLPLWFWQNLWFIAIPNCCCALIENKTHRKSFDYYVQLFHMLWIFHVNDGMGRWRRKKTHSPLKLV